MLSHYTSVMETPTYGNKDHYLQIAVGRNSFRTASTNCLQSYALIFFQINGNTILKIK